MTLENGLQLENYLSGTEDSTGGVAAFWERRKPDFKEKIVGTNVRKGILWKLKKWA